MVAAFRVGATVGRPERGPMAPGASAPDRARRAPPPRCRYHGVPNRRHDLFNRPREALLQPAATGVRLVAGPDGGTILSRDPPHLPFETPARAARLSEMRVVGLPTASTLRVYRRRDARGFARDEPRQAVARLNKEQGPRGRSEVCFVSRPGTRPRPVGKSSGVGFASMGNHGPLVRQAGTITAAASRGGTYCSARPEARSSTGSPRFRREGDPDGRTPIGDERNETTGTGYHDHNWCNVRRMRDIVHEWTGHAGRPPFTR